MKKTFKVLGICFLILVIACLIIFGLLISKLKAVNKTHEDVLFSISDDMYGRQVINNLYNDGLIKDVTTTLIYVKLTGKDDYKIGNYVLNDSMSTREIIDYISDVNNIVQDTVNITFIEGSWLKNFATLISNNTNLTYDELMTYWSDKNVYANLMNEYPFLTNEVLTSNGIRYYLEGYLFPDTYTFFKTTTCSQVTHKILDRTYDVYKEYEDKFKNSDLSIHEIFTLASIIQYEAGTLEDMCMVSGVFLNRLSIGMKLQSSATLCYVIDLDPSQSGIVCESEQSRNTESPYNTYMNLGLTPGPIVSPGEKAIYAALNPTDNEYLYFLADICHDGKVYYSKDYATHLAYKEKYLTCYN